MKNIYIVLGHRLQKNTKISKILQKRLDTCIKLVTKNDIIIVCGGNPAKQKHTEAYMMKKYILTHSDNENIIMENKSNTTVENFRNIHKILQNIHMETINKIYIITSRFHIQRSRYISKKYDYRFIYIEA